ncbi:MAG: type II secretion system protein N [Gammaproteobacteria bacterium]
MLLVFVLVLLLADKVHGQAESNHSDAIYAKAESPARSTEQSVETVFGLYLKGILATEDQHLGYAIIRSPDEQEWHFRVGESVYGLAMLEQIHIDRVILSRNGRRETLRLPAEFMAPDTALERARKIEARRIVSDFRSKLVNRDGMELIKMFGFDTAYRNGGFAGFTVEVVGEDGARMLEVLGVEAGDLITAVNGRRFAESIEAVQSLTELKDATEVDVEIERNGVPMFFHFDLDQLGAPGTDAPRAVSVVHEDAVVETEDSTTP